MNSKSFDTARIAEGYGKDRPFLHPQVMEEIKRELSLYHTMQQGLDIGCGAGMSARALKMLCENVVGTDISPEMIRAAKKLCGEDGYCFQCCKAEETRVEVPCDMVTAAGMINWVDRDALLHCLNPAMKTGAYLVVYDFWITDEMQGADAYREWWHQSYLPKFPKPFRKENIWTNDEAAPFGYTMRSQKELRLSWEFDLDSFVRFMLIQSNVNEQIARGNVLPEQMQEWFYHTLASIFHGQSKILFFTGYVWYLQKMLMCDKVIHKNLIDRPPAILFL